MIATIAATRRRYRAAVLADSPVAYWRLGEASGTTAADEMATYAGTYVGSPTLGVGGVIPVNTAATFNGSTQYVNMGDVFDMGTSDLTATLWFKNTTSAATQSFAGKQIAAVANYRYGFRYAAGGKISAFMQGDGGSDVFPTGTTSANDGNWHHYAAVFDRDANLSVYLDGVLEASASIAAWNGKNFQSTFPFRIGCVVAADGTSPAGAFNGSIDEVSIFMSALSAARILAHYQAARPPA